MRGERSARPPLFTLSLFHLFTFSPLKRPIPHATGRSDCRQKCRERGYYHLHRQLNDPLLLHTRIPFASEEHG